MLNKTEEPVSTPEFHRKGDLYSFGVIFYEIYFKEKMVKPMPENPLGNAFKTIAPIDIGNF